MEKINSQNLPKSKFKEEEWTEPPAGTQWPRQKRREYIKKLAVDIGLYNISKSELSEKMGISRRTLYNDILNIIKAGLDKHELLHSKIKINNALLKVMKEMHKILISGKTDAEKAKAGKVLIDATEAHTKFLESFGIKEQQTEVIDAHIIVEFGDKEE